ncbi:MAG: hypothetical protein ACI9JL_001080 [Paracoccaceae bacterium]|jgi:hypothetical protein
MHEAHGDMKHRYLTSMPGAAETAAEFGYKTARTGTISARHAQIRELTYYDR